MPSIHIRAWMCLFCICLQCFSPASASFASDVFDTFVKIKKTGQRDDDDDDEDYKEADDQSSEAEPPKEIETGKLETEIVKNEALYIAVIIILAAIAGLIAIGWILHCIFARKKKVYDEESPPPPPIDLKQKHKDYWDNVIRFGKTAPMHVLQKAIVVKKPKTFEIPEEISKELKIVELQKVPQSVIEIPQEKKEIPEEKTKASETEISQKSEVLSKELKIVDLQKVKQSVIEIPQEKKETTAGKPKVIKKTKRKKISPKLQDHKEEKVPPSSMEIRRELQTTDKKELQQTSFMDQVSPVKKSTPQKIKKVPGKPEKVSEFKGKPEISLETSSIKLKEYTWKEHITPKEIRKDQAQSMPRELIFKNKKIRCYMWNEDLPSGMQQPELQQTSFMDHVTPVKESTPQIIEKVPEFVGKPDKVDKTMPEEICRDQAQSVPGKLIFKNERIRCYMWNEDLPSGMQQPELQQTSFMDHVTPVKESTPQIIEKVPEFVGKPDKVDKTMPEEICRDQAKSVPGKPIFKNERIRCYMWNEDLPSGMQQPGATLRPKYPGKIIPIPTKDRDDHDLKKE